MFEKHELASHGLSNYDYSLKNLIILLEWIDESSEANLNEKFGVEPGDLYRMVETTYWLSYCLYEIAKLIGRKDLLPEIAKLRLRIKHGIKSELISLIHLRELEELGQGLYIRQESLMLMKLTRFLNQNWVHTKNRVKLAKKLKNQIKN